MDCGRCYKTYSLRLLRGILEILKRMIDIFFECNASDTPVSAFVDLKSFQLSTTKQIETMILTDIKDVTGCSCSHYVWVIFFKIVHNFFPSLFFEI